MKKTIGSHTFSEEGALNNNEAPKNNNIQKKGRPPRKRIKTKSAPIKEFSWNNLTKPRKQ